MGREIPQVDRCRNGEPSQADILAADDDAKPTASAISQHIYKLQKANGSGSPSKAKPAGVFKPSTPSTKRVNNPKTPSSSSKRQKTHNMSDEDDDDDEVGDFSNLAKRETSARRSKPARGAYVEPNSEDDDNDDNDDFLRSARSESRSINPTLTNTAGYVSPISKRTSVYDDEDEEVTITASRSVSKRPISNFDYFRQTREDSDASDYQPLV